MVSVEPDRERDSPLLESRAEVLGAVNRIEYRRPAGEVGIRLDKRLLANEADVGVVRAKVCFHLALEVNIGVGDGAAVGLPCDGVAARREFGKLGFDQGADAFEH